MYFGQFFGKWYWGTAQSFIWDYLYTLGELRKILKALKQGGDGIHDSTYLNESKNDFTSKIHLRLRLRPQFLTLASFPMLNWGFGWVSIRKTCENSDFFVYVFLS